MHIHIGHSDNCLHSVDVSKIDKHKALPHISKFVTDHPKHYVNKIKQVRIENSKLNEHDYNALQNIFHECIHLNEININSNHIETNNCQNLFAALSGKKLTSISFTDNWIGAKLPDNYFDVFNEQHEISSIDFSLNWLGDKGISIFLNSLKKNIRKLELSCNDFYLEGMISIRKFILQCKELAELDISYNRINAQSAEQIAHLINESPSLVYLKINHNYIGDKGASSIAETLNRTSTLTKLDVSDNQISNKGARYLIEGAVKNNNIKQLDLRHNSLNPEDLNQLTERWAGTLEILT